MNSDMMTIGKLAEVCHVNVDTLRYYERIKLLFPDNRTPSGYRIYGEKAKHRVLFIRKAQSLGFTLNEISKLLRYDGSTVFSADVIRQLTEKKLAQHKKKIEELIIVEDILDSLMNQCTNAAPTQICPIIEYLNKNNDSELINQTFSNV